MDSSIVIRRLIRKICPPFLEICFQLITGFGYAARARDGTDTLLEVSV